MDTFSESFGGYGWLRASNIFSVVLRERHVDLLSQRA